MTTRRSLTAILVLAGLGCAGAVSAGSCSNERPAEVFAALEAIDEAGEARLNEKLTTLSAQEGWSQSEWQAYVLKLADNPRADALESRRDELVSYLLGLLARPPYDCDLLDQVEAEILDVERRQWDDSIEQVERRIARGAEPDYL